MTSQLTLAFLLLIAVPAAWTAEPQDAATGTDDVKNTNRLAQESSPYLLLHAHNPVNWYPWGPEALEKARSENKPIFLSIGYSSCYWCHVMERQVFASERIAEFMNEHFVNIKVDREERPDIDEIYMTALIVYLQASGQGGGGGWPLSMFLTPDGNPIAGGTYMPPEDTPDGRAGFLTIAGRVDEMWQTRENALRASASAIAGEVRRLTGPRLVGEPLPLQPKLVEGSVAAVRSHYDPVWGGVDFRPERPNSPRFPSAPRLNLLLTHARRHSDSELMRIVEHSLTAMAEGGIRDHLGGGFHRYSTDRRWHVPHFEKMLYDQAMLLQLYATMAEATGDARYREVAADIAGFVRREMTLPEGGFCSALDAETNAIEGEYYVWQPEEIRAVLGDDDAELFFRAYGMTTPSPFEHGYVLHLPRSLNELATAESLDERELRTRLSAMRDKLLAVRDQRERPLLDDKVLTEWNALMIRALAVSGTLPGHEQDLTLARNAAEFLLSRMKDERGHLQRSWRQGQTSGAACLDDYAVLVAALRELHRATGEPKWLEEARALTRLQIDLFYDQKLATFYYTPHDHEQLIARTSTVFDSVSESGNSVTIRNLIALSDQDEGTRLSEIAESMLQQFSPVLQESPAACSGLALALSDWLQSHPPESASSPVDAAAERPTTADDGGSDSAADPSADEPLCGQPPRDEPSSQPDAPQEPDQEPDAAAQTVFRPVIPDPAAPKPFARDEEDRPVSAKIYPMFDKLERGGKCPVAIELTIDKQWHINANPSHPDFLVPTEIRIRCEQKVRMTKIKYPKHELLFVPNSDEKYHVYGRKVIIYALLETDAAEAADNAEIAVTIRYQACNEKECLPPDDIVMKGKLPLVNPGAPVRRINEDKFPKPKDEEGDDEPAADNRRKPSADRR